MSKGRETYFWRTSVLFAPLYIHALSLSPGTSSLTTHSTDLITQLEQFARMTLAKHTIFGISGGATPKADVYALVHRGASAGAHTVKRHLNDLKGIWDALDWADGLALSLPAFPSTDPTPSANNNVTTHSAHLAAVAAAKKYVDGQSNVRGKSGAPPVTKI